MNTPIKFSGAQLLVHVVWPTRVRLLSVCQSALGAQMLVTLEALGSLP